MSFDYKKVLVIGATSGIGKALAEKLVDNGISVIVAGRRQENLNEFAQRYGSDKKVQAKVFDALKLDRVSLSLHPRSHAVNDLDPTIRLRCHRQ